MLQTGSCLSLEVARILNEMIALRSETPRAPDSALQAQMLVTSSSQQLSHRAKAICRIRSYTFSPWFHQPNEIFVMAYLLWEMVASIRFKIIVV
jgi:hypothetical protein